MFPKKVYYGLRYVLALSLLAEGEHIRVAEVAEREKLPVKFLETIAVALRKNGVVNVKRGAGGGYYLAKSLSEITLYDLISVLDDKSEKQIPLTGSHSEKAVGKYLNEVKKGYELLLNDCKLDKLKSMFDEQSGQIMYYI